MFPHGSKKDSLERRHPPLGESHYESLSKSLEPPQKRTRVSLAKGKENLDLDLDQDSELVDIQSKRVRYWSEQGTWPRESEERAMQSFQKNHVFHALARRRSSQLGRKRSSGSLAAETDASGDQKVLLEESYYKDGQAVIDLKMVGSFMDDHEEGITPESKTLCQKLLTAPQAPSENTLFSDDKLFQDLCKMVKGQNEATVKCYIRPELVPSPKIRKIRGAKHLQILNETIDASWINAEKCCNRRPRPDYSIGIDREAFSTEHMKKLLPFIGSRLDEESRFGATFDTCFPFLTTEVKCGAAAFDIADGQNAVSQTVALRGLDTLFRLVGRQQELHRKVLGFSISHDNEQVRIYGHYLFIDGEKTTYHRCLISEFGILPTVEGDQRWKTSRFVQNVQDLWATEHFEMICSAVDMLPPVAELFQLSAPSSQTEQSFGPSGLSQELQLSGIADEPHNQAAQ
ncbi:hypothetical protein HDV64DRAFT_107353 [Trichoderma sp. TUCIM 5745]